MNFSLSYDRLGSRMTSIADRAVFYDRAGTRPVTLGSWHLGYDRLGSRLRSIGPHPLAYDRLGSRPIRFDSWDFGYDRLGSRLRRIGPYEVTYDHATDRVATVGAMSFGYDSPRLWPDTVEIAAASLDETDLAVLYVVLHYARQVAATRRGR